jgi:hypothetical protein
MSFARERIMEIEKMVEKKSELEGEEKLCGGFSDRIKIYPRCYSSTNDTENTR